MKRIIAFSLCLALCLSLSACFKRTEEPTQTQAPTTETVTKSEVKENVYNYELLEDTLDKYVYDCIGGWMKYVMFDKKLYFADHQYGTTAVNFYDFSSGSIKNMAIDDDNKLSGPYQTGQKSIVVASLPENADPLEVEPDEVRYHIYDLQKQKLFVLEKRFEFQIISYLDGKVYGNDEQGRICICNEDGSEKEHIVIGDYEYLQNVWKIDGDIYAELYNMNGKDRMYKLVKISNEKIEELVDTTVPFFFDSGEFYYTKASGSNTVLTGYDVSTGKSEEVCNISAKVGYLYFIAGDRVYFQTKLDDYNIALRYFDLKTGEEKEFSTGTPAMGGW